MNRCTRCNAEAVPSARFCAECGGELAPAAPSDPIRLEINRNRIYMKDWSGLIEFRLRNRSSESVVVRFGLTSSTPEALATPGDIEVRLEPGGSRVSPVPVDPRRAGDLLYAVQVICETPEGTTRLRSEDLVLKALEKAQSLQSLAITIDNSFKAGGDMSAISSRAQSDLGRQIGELARSGSGINEVMDRAYPDAWHPVELVGMLFNGFGVPKDVAEGIRWQIRAAEAGNTNAMFLLANWYYDGTRVERNEQEALRWFLAAAEKGDLSSMSRLGYSYETGNGATQDFLAARRWYRRAAEKGDSYSMYRLGVLNAAGQGGDKDAAEAFRWYVKAAKAGNVSGMHAVGYAYEEGRGVPHDLGEASVWYRRAADKGSATAMYNLACLYRMGKGVQTDFAQALHWFLKAAEAGDRDGMAMAGWMYKKGEGVASNPEEAARWLKKASANGHKLADQWLTLA